jgi:4-diphosphocytidyl-2-C-methyl-D-erythritol kinase
MITVFAPAKINLALRITGKRADGYHDLCSLVGFADYGDWLEITPATQDQLTITGPYAAALRDLPPEENSLWRVLGAYRQAGGKIGGLQIALHKFLPPQGGVGGGAADAGALLRFLNAYGTTPAAVDWHKIAQAAGADGPMCYHSAALIAQGIGAEIIRLTRLPDLYGWLLLPDSKVDTKSAFSMVKTYAPLPAWSSQRIWDVTDLRGLQNAQNDFAPVLQSAYADWPDWPTLLGREHQAAVLYGLSGSGSTHFVLCANRAAQAQIGPALSTWRGGKLKAIRLGGV